MRRRLAAVTLATALLIVLAFVVPLGLLVRRQAEERALSSAESDSRSVATALAVASAFAAEPLTADGVAAVLGAFGSPQGVGVFLADETVVGTGVPGDPDVAVARQGAAFTARTASGAAVLVPVLTGGDVLVVRADVPAAELQRGVAQAWLALGLLGALLVLVALTASDRLGRTIVNPVAALRRATAALGSGDPTVRVEPSGPPEIVAVGHAFNDLAERLAALLQAEREAAADISHGLRTPVAALRLQVDTITEPGLRRTLLDDVTDLEAAIDGVIREARSRGESDPLGADLTAVARDRTQFWSVLAAEQGRTFKVSIADGPLPAPVTGRQAATVLDTLLENVFAHTAAGSPIRITVGPGTRLMVEDGGTGFDLGAMRRGTTGGRSTGLGLDIVRGIAERSGGALAVTRSDLGGACVAVRLGSA